MLYKITCLMFLVLAFGFSNVSAQTEMPVKLISGGVVNGRADSLPKPEYPAAARAVKASGAVNVQIVIDEQGNVVSASAVSGHPLLRQAAEAAAREAKFKPTLLSGQAVRVTGVLVYNFVGEPGWLSAGFSLATAEAKGIGTKINLPDEFKNEQEQLEMIAKLPLAEQKNQLPAIVALVKSRLNAADLWRFEFGLAKGGVINNVGDNAVILTNLAKFRDLSNNRAEGVLDYEINRAVELAKYADKRELTEEDRQTILGYLK